MKIQNLKFLEAHYSLIVLHQFSVPTSCEYFMIISPEAGYILYVDSMKLCPLNAEQNNRDKYYFIESIYIYTRM